MGDESFESWKSFFFPKETVHNHWYAPVDNFQFVTNDFYKKIEGELAARNVPGLEITRIEFNEGGLLSAKREYLRLRRERLVFDICAAPFGTGFFFSFRFVELPLGIKPAELLVVLMVVFVVPGLFIYALGVLWGTIGLLGLIGVGITILRNAVALGLKDLDAMLLKAPIIGPLYELLVRKETYYRQDTRLMYLSTVDSITKALLDDITAAKGIRKVKRYERQPLLGNIYRETEGGTDDEPPAKAA